MEITTGKILGALKIVVYGPEGIGKSTFASQFPRPVFIDTEGSTKHMDVARTPKPTSWAMLMEQVKWFRDNPSQYGTLILDTADWAEQLCVDAVCARAGKTGIEDFGYGKGYVYLTEEFEKLLRLLEEVVERGTNVVLTAHAKMRKFEQPDEMGAYDRWEMKLQKNNAPLVKEWADMVLFANYKTFVINVDGQGTEKGKNKAQGGKRVMYTTHHPCWDAKNRHNLKEELPFNFKEIAHCVAASESKPIQPPVEIPKEEPTIQEPTPEQSKAEDDSRETAMGALRDLMKQSNVMDYEIKAVVALKGYFPEDTPFENYPIEFITGVLIGAWPQVLKMILDKRPLPF